MKAKEAECLAAIRAARKSGISQMTYLKELLYLANVYTCEGKFSEAKPVFEDVIKSAEKQFGKNSKNLLTPLSNYGYMLKMQGKLKESEAIVKRMRQITDSQ